MLFKGKTKIELFDGNSGKLVKRHIDTNMVTKALDYFAEYGGITNPSIFYNSNLRTNFLYYMLGGVLCLDTAIAENNEIVRVPAGVRMVANGARDILNTGDPIELGSFNENESGWQVDGSLKLVWDWTTSQGNGTIACVCLTSLVAGMQGIGNPSLTSKSNSYNLSQYNSAIALSSSQEPCLGVYNNTVYNFSAAPSQGSSFTIIKRGLPMDSMDIRDTLALREIGSFSIQKPHDISGYDRGQFRTYQNGRYAYLIIAYASTSGSYYTRHFEFTNDHPVRVYKFDLATETLVDSWSLSPSSTGAAAISDLGGGTYPTLFCNGKFAVFSKYIFPLSDITDYSVIENTAEDTYMMPVNDDIAYSASGRLDMPNALRLPINNTQGYSTYEMLPHYSPLIAMATGDPSQYPYHVIRDPRYIATINNLEEPVVKTPDKTMKVTYTISFDN